MEWPQPVISKHVLKFRVLSAIEKTACFVSLLAHCFLFICERGDIAPQMERLAVETSSLGGKKWDAAVSECRERRKLETRQKCVYLCQLLSWPSSRLPLPSVRRENERAFRSKSFPDSVLFRGTSLLLFRVSRDSSEVLRAALPLVFIQDRKLILSL